MKRSYICVMELIDINTPGHIKAQFKEFLRTKIAALDEQINLLYAEKKTYTDYLDSGVFRNSITLESSGMDIALFCLSSAKKAISRADIKSVIDSYNFSESDNAKLL